MPYHSQPFNNYNLNSANVSTTFSSTSENDLPWDDDTTFYYQPPFGLVSPAPLIEDYSRMPTGAAIRPSPSAAPHPSDTGPCHRQCRRCSPQNPAYGNAPASGSRSEVHHHAHHNQMRTPASAVEAPIHRPTPSRTPSRTPSQRSGHTSESSSSHLQARLGDVQAQARDLIECRWEGCDYLGGFSREATLFRHIRNIHLAPRRYTCPIGPNCRAFNRKDNLISHIHSVHRLPYQPSDLDRLQVPDS